MEQLITSNFKLGILGGGQLGKMLTLTASNWDVKTYVLDPSDTCPASNTCNYFVKGDYSSYDSVYNFCKHLDMITVEIENVNIDALLKLKKEGKKIFPNPEILKTIKDKGLQKQFYAKHNLPTSKFKLFSNKQEVLSAIQNNEISIPFVQKLRTDGYDGKGVVVINNNQDFDNIFNAPSVIEEKVKIEKEIAVIVCRSTKNEVKCFPVVEMEFNPVANLVEYLICPASISMEIAKKATEIAKKIIAKFDYEGILAVEMFLDKKNNILINEIAPRPHNSGHHTIEGTFTSQYEQHLRAIFGFPLGSTNLKLPSIMINILGEKGFEGNVKYEGLTKCMHIEGVKLHIYGKKITKPYRKMGHATILDHDINSAKEKAKFIKKNLKVVAYN